MPASQNSYHFYFHFKKLKRKSFSMSMFFFLSFHAWLKRSLDDDKKKYTYHHLLSSLPWCVNLKKSLFIVMSLINRCSIVLCLQLTLAHLLSSLREMTPNRHNKTSDDWARTHAQKCFEKLEFSSIFLYLLASKISHVHKARTYRFGFYRKVQVHDQKVANYPFYHHHETNWCFYF